MPNFQKLIDVERMIMVLLHVAHKWRQLLAQKLNTLKGLHRPSNDNPSTLLTHVQGFVNFLFWYIAALFMIESQVSDYHWAPEMGEHAKGPLLSCCLHVLMRLTLGYEEKV